MVRPGQNLAHSKCSVSVPWSSHCLTSGFFPVSYMYSDSHLPNQPLVLFHLLERHTRPCTLTLSLALFPVPVIETSSCSGATSAALPASLSAPSLQDFSHRDKRSYRAQRGSHPGLVMCPGHCGEGSAISDLSLLPLCPPGPSAWRKDVSIPVD